MMLYDLLKGKIGLTKFIQFQNKLLLDNLSINGRNISNYTEDDDIYLVKKENDNE